MEVKDYQNFETWDTDLQGWQGDSLIFEKLIAEVKPSQIIEVGSWKGQSTITMAKALKEHGLYQTRILAIDTWLGAEEFYTQPTPERDLMKRDGYPQVYYQFLSNIINSGVVDMIEPIPLPSVIGARIAPQASLIYIDGSHHYEDVLADVRAFWKKLREQGVIFGDDYRNGAFGGVKKAVDEFAKEVGAVVEVYDNWFWIIRK